MRPDFYLTSVDSYDLDPPRACHALKAVAWREGPDLLVVSVNPALDGKFYGHPDREFRTVALAPRFQGTDITQVRSEPVHVFVCQLLVDDIQSIESVPPSACRILSWGVIYPSEELAKMKRSKFSTGEAEQIE